MIDHELGEKGTGANSADSAGPFWLVTLVAVDADPIPLALCMQPSEMALEIRELDPQHAIGHGCLLLEPLLVGASVCSDDDLVGDRPQRRKQRSDSPPGSLVRQQTESNTGRNETVNYRKRCRF
jgi:hypothetical protein